MTLYNRNLMLVCNMITAAAEVTYEFIKVFVFLSDTHWHSNKQHWEPFMAFSHFSP